MKKFWNLCLEKGDITKKPYKGLYCKGCESFKTTNHCEDHPTTKIEEVVEENYFFSLKNYKYTLLDFVGNHDFIQPESKKKELLNYIQEFDEISISRQKSSCPWGVEVPSDPEQTVYVWFDALINYIVASGWGRDNSDFQEYWNNSIQLCGPDNIRFQGQILQSILLSGGLNPSNKLLVHGTVLDSEGRKISKSVGNIIDPIELLNQFSSDQIRWYILSQLNTYQNCNWNNEELKSVWNDLSNSWGNLISRVLHLVDKFGIEEDGELPTEWIDLKNQSQKLWEQFEQKLAIQKTNELVWTVNKWINDTKPWESKDSKQISKLYRILQTINDLYKPVIPNISNKVDISINNKKKSILFEKF